MHRIKALFISTFLVVLVAAVGLSVWEWAHGPRGSPWIGTLIASGAPLLFFARLFIAPTPRTSANLWWMPAIGVAGMLTAAVLGGLGLPTLIALAAGIVLPLVYIFWYSRFDARDAGPLSVGRQLPDLELEGLDGRTFHSDELTLRPTLWLFYRGNWCPFCMAQIRPGPNVLRLLRRLLMICAILTSGAAGAFDHSYSGYSALLGKHVHWMVQRHASAVNYSTLNQERPAVAAMRKSLSAVGQSEFDSWSREQQMAFLINAYNVFTLELILTKHPDLASIKDLGNLFRSPWKIEFFTLLGNQRHLDWIEHEQLRPRYRDPRVHFAINCASVGCPALRPEAYVPERLNAQLDDQQRHFLGDRVRNRFNPADGTLAVSPIFKWFTQDFEAAGRGSLKQWLAIHAEDLAVRESDRVRIRGGDFEIKFLDYDWSLNAFRQGAP